MTPDELSATMGRLGLSVAEVARLMRVDARTVRRWLTGDRDVSEIAKLVLELFEAVPAAMEHARRTRPD